MTRSLRLAFLALTLCLAAVGAAPRPAQAQRPRDRVVLISLDGFWADYLDDPRAPLPHLRALARRGARVDRMTVSTPSVTWPNHTTLVTGVSPRRHGVIANGMVEKAPSGPAPLAINPRHSKAEMCRVPTLYDVAHAAGLKTAEVNWPVTRHAPSLDFSFPDHPEAIRNSTPEVPTLLRVLNLLEQPTDAAFSAVGSATRDRIWTEVATHLIRQSKPNLLLLHLLNTDGTQHAHGPQTTEAFTVLALADRYVGDVLEAIRTSGGEDRTTVVVTADHGFIRVTRQIRPNARLRARGLIRGDGPDTQFDAQCISEGGVALVYVPGRAPDRTARVRTALTGLEGVERILEPAQYAEFGIPDPAANPQGPDFVLCAAEGFAFTNDHTGEETVTLPRPIGTHGYLHTNPKMDALLVLGGRGIRKGARLERARNTDVAPTLAQLLRLRLPDTEGSPLASLLAP
jgi:predicted AlkP superfamily pyrophosphatase or phosphodiesterase